jgi:hypothetical protein
MPVDTSSDPIILETFPARAGYYIVTDVFVMMARSVSREDGKKDLKSIFVASAIGSPDEIEVIGQESTSKSKPQLQLVMRGNLQPDGKLADRKEYLIDGLWKDPNVTEADGVWEEGETPENEDGSDYRYREGDTYKDKNKNWNLWAQWMYGDAAEPAAYPGLGSPVEPKDGEDPPPPAYEGLAPDLKYPRYGGKSATEIAALSDADRAKYEDAIAAEIAKLSTADKAIVNKRLQRASPWRETTVNRRGIGFIDLYQQVRIGEEASSTDPHLRDWLVSHEIDPLPSGSKIQDSAIATFSITIVSNQDSHPQGADVDQSTLPFNYPDDYKIPSRTGLTKYQMRPTVLGVIVN